VDWHPRGKRASSLDTSLPLTVFKAHALYQNLSIPCKVYQFGDKARVLAHDQLLDHVEAYFKTAARDNDRSKVVTTLRPPIYFQRPGHSMTIVGLEVMRNGMRNLLVFDPMYRAPGAMEQLVRRERRLNGPNHKLMSAYRRAEYRLEPYLDFEVLE
jgi:hypothetical protein